MASPAGRALQVMPMFLTGGGTVMLLLGAALGVLGVVRRYLRE